MKPVSIHPWPGNGGMVQVAGTSAWAKKAVEILKAHDCRQTGWSVTGNKGDRIYTYRVDKDVWHLVVPRLRNLDDELQMVLFRK